jgi:PEP-CTERM motif
VYSGSKWNFSNSPLNEAILKFSIYDAYGNASSPYYMHVNLFSDTDWSRLGISWMDRGWGNSNYDVNVLHGSLDPSFNRTQGWNNFEIQWSLNHLSIIKDGISIIDTSINNPLDINGVEFVMHDYYGGSQQFGISNISLETVPEPSTYALFGIGAIGMLIVLRRKKSA